MFGIRSSKLKLLFFLLPLALLLALSACEGPEGPQGPAGEKGDQGDQGDRGNDYPNFSYLGDNANTCGHCHAMKVEGWEGTLHSEAYDALVADGEQNNLYCLQCHTVGFDSDVAYGDTVIATYGPNLHGYDDYVGKTDAESVERMADLHGVQCESCHGPMGPTIYNHQPNVSFATGDFGEGEESLCAKCHTDQLAEWKESGHGRAIPDLTPDREEFTAEWGRESCRSCHTSEGFIMVNDVDHANLIEEREIELENAIGCPTCHDPHANKNESQLRNLNDVTVMYAVNDEGLFTEHGPAQLCAQCHHGRRDSSNVEGQISRGTTRFGPHESPQMDMFVGSGAYEINDTNALGERLYTYDRGRGVGHYASVTDACVSCHMSPVTRHGSPYPDHHFAPKVEACQTCHPGVTDFNVGDGQAEVEELLDEILAIMETRHPGISPDSLGNPRWSTAEERKATYAYAFVHSDLSMGVHNPTYAKSLLNNAIAHLNTLP
jgi:hypothetical protein